MATNIDTPKTRYAQPRQLLNWNKNDHLKILKMLAWVVYIWEGVRNAATLERRVAALCEPVTYNILGDGLMTYHAIQEQTFAEQGAAITATKLMQRADKADRYDELNEFADKVLQAYKLLSANSSVRD